MRYIIASHEAISHEGWQPSSARIIDGHVILNENELRYRYTDKSLEESASIVDGIIVTRQTAIDFLSGIKKFEQIKAEGIL